MPRILLAVLALALAPCKLPGQAAPAQTPQDSVFRIVPRRPIEELRREATRQAPPPQPDSLLAADLVDVTALDPAIRLDIRYATTGNFMGERMYSSAVVSNSRVVTPGRAASRSSSSVSATTRPAARMRSTSRGPLYSILSRAMSGLSAFS